MEKQNLAMKGDVVLEPSLRRGNGCPTMTKHRNN
jgi:hypothetical protein